MKTNEIVVWRWLLPLLLCVLLPMAVGAQTKIPYLFIEKTDGSVVKVSFGETYPVIYSSTRDDESTGRTIGIFSIITGEDRYSDYIEIPCSEVKRFYTEFETTEDIAGVEMKTEESATIYSSNGMVVGAEEQLSKMPKGVYLMKKGKKTIKHIKP